MSFGSRLEGKFRIPRDRLDCRGLSHSVGFTCDLTIDA